VERLAARGIETLAQLARTPERELTAWFGARQGPHLRSLASFHDERPIVTERAAKSESRETTFERDLRGLGALEPVLEQLTRELCTTLGRQHNCGRTIGIKVRLDDFSTHTRARTLDEPTNDLSVVLAVARELLRTFDPQRPVRLLGVRVAGLDEHGAASVSPPPPPGQMALSL
jgi:DNA polymerase-4